MMKPKAEARHKIGIDNVVTFDIESYDWTNPVALGMYHHGSDTYRVFTGENCIEKFVDEFVRRKWRNHHFYAHNGGRYDFIPVIEELADREGFEAQFLTRNSDVFYARVSKTEGKPETRFLHDSIALIPLSLREAADAFAPEQPKGEFDYEDIGPIRDMPADKRNEMLDYLKQDCISLYHVISNFNSLVDDMSNGRCGIQLTLGSTTMAIYQTCYQPRNLFPDGEAESYSRESFYGGRTEVYDMYCPENEGPYYHYDVNSLYPHSYSNFKVPVGPVFETGSDFPLDNPNVGGVVRVSGYVPQDACYGVPVLPYRAEMESGYRVVFPAGEIEGWYCPTEVRYARDVGALTDIEIHDGYGCKRGIAFNEFGNSLFNMKQNIDSCKSPGRYWTVKLFLNSFFGKFGMDREQDQIVKIDEHTPENLKGLKEINLKLADLGIFEETTESEAKYIIPSIASEITARARIEMHDWFMKVFDKGGNLWYCDTDSIVTDVKLPEGGGLGEMDLEGEIREAFYLAPKVYAEHITDGDNVIKAKGMKDLEASIDDFRKAFDNDDPELIGTEWDGPRGFKSGMKNNSEDWFTKTDFSRSLKQFDQKRSHNETVNGGANSKPLFTSELTKGDA